MRSLFRRCGFGVLIGASGLIAALAADDSRTSAPRWRQHDIRRPKPPVVEPAKGPIVATPPKDAIVLFDGSNLNEWQSPGGAAPGWKLTGGAMQTAPGTGPIETKRKFGDIQLHIEWAAPNPAVGVGQDRGNSGIFLMGQFEVQVLDSYKADTYADGQAGALYGEYPPLFNASRPPGEWQTYDVAFRRPRFDSSGAVKEPAKVTLFHNGILVQNNEELFGPTTWLKWLPYVNEGDKGVLSLQDHDHPVKYRNIWVRELPERPAPTAKDLERLKVISLSNEILDKYVGGYLTSTKPDAKEAKITREGGHLVIVFPNRPQSLVMEPISETEFEMPFTDGHFTFQKDGQGKVTGVLFRVGDGDRVMKRVSP